MAKTVFVDLETTGLVPKMMVNGKRGRMKKEQIPYDTMFDKYPRVVSGAWKVDDDPTYYSVLNQEGNPIPKEASDIHKITDQIANSSNVTFIHFINNFILQSSGNDIVVGFNMYYDTSIIKANVLREIKNGRLTQKHYDVICDILDKDKRIDVMRRAMKMMGGFATLQAVHMKIFRRGFDAHNAQNDVDALKRIYDWMLPRGIVPSLEELKQKALERDDDD